MDASENNDLPPTASADPNRNPDGTFATGNKLSPGGKPKNYTRADLQERATFLLRKYTVKEIAALYNDKKALQDLTVEDASLLARMVGMIQRDGGKEFDRFYNQLIGKPVQTTELTGAGGEQLFNSDNARAEIESKLLPELAARDSQGAAG